MVNPGPTETCARKVRYRTWDEARRAGLETWLNHGRRHDANAPTAYPCDTLGELHYHCGHLRRGATKVA
jgi:hypothetical protein